MLNHFLAVIKTQLLSWSKLKNFADISEFFRFSFFILILLLYLLGYMHNCLKKNILKNPLMLEIMIGATKMLVESGSLNLYTAQNCTPLHVYRPPVYLYLRGKLKLYTHA